MEVVKPKPAGREPVDVRRADQAAETADLGKTDIVEQEDDHVRRTLGRTLLFWPPLLGILVLLGNHALEALDRLRPDLLRVRSARSGHHDGPGGKDAPHCCPCSCLAQGCFPLLHCLSPS